MCLTEDVFMCLLVKFNKNPKTVVNMTMPMKLAVKSFFCIIFFSGVNSSLVIIFHNNRER